MINKLKSRIFVIIMISLIVIVFGIIMIFTFMNYNNTINTANLIIDRFVDIGIKKDSKDRPDEQRIIPQELNIEGLFNVIIRNGQVINKNESIENIDIENYAKKIIKRDNEKGIIGNYIYKIRKIGEDTYNIILMENEEAITHIRKIFVFSILASALSLIIIYIIAKKVSKIIVEPVQQTFEKQKQFISDASHELKTPLAVIEANADVLENEIGRNKWMDYIQNEIQSMDKLINELLLLAKTEYVDELKYYEKLDLSKEAEIIVSMFESMAYENKVKIESDIQKDIIINGNKEDVKHILSTLIDNAIKHSEPEKEVKVEISKEKNQIIIQVKNTGKIIPEEERDKIFERFYRIDKSRNRNEKRYGLGLAIAKSIIEKYNGKIEVICKNGITNFKIGIPT